MKKVNAYSLLESEWRDLEISGSHIAVSYTRPLRLVVFPRWTIANCAVLLRVLILQISIYIILLILLSDESSDPNEAG